MKHINLILTIILSTTYIAACQESALSTDAWMKIISYCHYSVGRCINRVFRDNISYVSIDTPIRLHIGPLAKYQYYKEPENRRDFLYQGIQQNKIKMCGTWVLEECCRTGLEDFLDRMREQESLKLHIPLGKGGGYDDMHYMFVAALNSFIRKNKVLKELSLSFDNTHSTASIGHIPLGLKIGNKSRLEKFTLDIAALKRKENDLSVVPFQIQVLRAEIADNKNLKDVTITVERHPIRVRPWCEEDIEWFEFMCGVKTGNIVSKKAKAPWYWSKRV